MVNDRFLPWVGAVFRLRRERGQLSPLIEPPRIDSNAIEAGSFKLSENLTLICVEYGQKPRLAANRTFKALC
jgi:hypothetical protein